MSTCSFSKWSQYLRVPWQVSLASARHFEVGVAHYPQRHQPSSNAHRALPASSSRLAIWHWSREVAKLNDCKIESSEEWVWVMFHPRTSNFLCLLASFSLMVSKYFRPFGRFFSSPISEGRCSRRHQLILNGLGIFYAAHIHKRWICWVGCWWPKKSPPRCDGVARLTMNDVQHRNLWNLYLDCAKLWRPFHHTSWRSNDSSRLHRWFLRWASGRQKARPCVSGDFCLFLKNVPRSILIWMCFSSIVRVFLCLPSIPLVVAPKSSTLSAHTSPCSGQPNNSSVCWNFLSLTTLSGCVFSTPVSLTTPSGTQRTRLLAEGIYFGGIHRRARLQQFYWKASRSRKSIASGSGILRK